MDALLGTIALDAIYTPIKNVNYSIENFRVEQKTDFEKLIMEIQTYGSIAPQDALTDAAQILIQHFLLFTDERMIPDSEPVQEVESYDEEVM